MAIDFPTSPSNGSTYLHQGVVFTFKDTGGGTGFWQITGPGTYGVATSGEIDTGTDAIKYVSPSALAGSKYVRESAGGSTVLYYGGVASLTTQSTNLQHAGRTITSQVATANTMYHRVMNSVGGMNFGIDTAGNGSLKQLDSTGNVQDTWVSMGRNSGVTLYHNNVVRAVTDLNGMYVTTSGTTYVSSLSSGSNSASFRASNTEGGLEWRADGDTATLRCYDSSFTLSSIQLKGTRGEGVKLYYASGLKFETTSTGGTINGDLRITDDLVLEGPNPAVYVTCTDTSDARIRLRNTEGGAEIIADNGSMYIRTTDANGSNPQNGVLCAYNGATHIYYNNSSKIYTHGSGAGVTGYLSVTGSGNFHTYVLAQGQDAGAATCFVGNTEGGVKVVADGDYGYFMTSDPDFVTNVQTHLRGNNTTGRTSLFNANVEKFWTNSTGVHVNGKATQSGQPTASIDLTPRSYVDDRRLGKYIMYTNDAGGTGTITLNDDHTDYDLIIVEGLDGTAHSNIVLIRPIINRIYAVAVSDVGSNGQGDALLFRVINATQIEITSLGWFTGITRVYGAKMSNF